MLYKKRIGSYGEKAAAYFLRQKGHVVLRQNLRLKTGEIDLLSLKDEMLYINEVKTAIDTSTVSPEYNFNNAKLKKLRTLAAELSQGCYTGNSFMNNILSADEMANIKGVVVNGICVYLTLNYSYACPFKNRVSGISIKFFEDLFVG